MKKPMIAIMPLYDRERDSYWMLPQYMKGIERAGGIPVMLPLTANKDVLNCLAEQYDGFLLTGGQDVSPSLYGRETSSLCGEICEARDQMEYQLIEEILRIDKPMLGICRGMQLLNVVLGGTLYQDLPAEYPSQTEHHQKPPYDRPTHTVKIETDTPLFTLLKQPLLSVNSYHHQGIQQISDQLRPMAVAEDGLMEAVYLKNARFVWAVQWHPEFLCDGDDDQFAILKAFVDASDKR